VHLLHVFAIGTMCFLLSACGGGGGGDGGGGGGGDDTSISLSTSSLSFEAYASSGGSPPQQITVSFSGAGVVIGTLPGQTLPIWLPTPSVVSQTGSQALVSIRTFTSTLQPGTYTSTLRFVTGREDQTNLKTSDLVVTLRVNAPMSASVSGTLNFLALEGDPAGARATGASTIRIAGDRLAWQATADQPWVRFDATSGTQPRDLVVSVDRQSLGIGTYTAQIRVRDDNSTATRTFPINLEIRRARLTASVAELAFTLDPATVAANMERTIAVSDELNGQVPSHAISWTATVDDSWLELSSTSGSTSPSQAIVARLSALHANLIGSGSHSTEINLSYAGSGGTTSTVTIPVTLEVRLPVARAVTPYFIPPNTPTTVRVRGEDIRANDIASLSIQGIPSPAFTRLNDTHLTLALPALPSGEYELRFSNAAGLTRSAATVIVGNAPAIGAGVIESPNKKRIFFDEQRGRIVAVDRQQFQVETYTWNGSAWVAGTTLSVPEVADAALARSGKDLIIIARQAIYVADPDDLSAPMRTVWTRPTTPSYVPSLNAISINDQGAALITQTYHFVGISGHTPLVYFDALRLLVSGSPTGFDTVYEAQLGRSPGGRYTVASTLGISPVQPTLVFDSYMPGETLLGALTQFTTTNPPSRDIDHAGTRMLEGSDQVRTLQGALLGTLGGPWSTQPYKFAVLSPNGTRAFKLVEALSGNGTVEVHDLTATPAPAYPVLGSIPMPSRVANPNETPFVYPGATFALAGLVTPNAPYLILAGPERTVVVDVSGF
jgi:hypothetical protein